LRLHPNRTVLLSLYRPLAESVGDVSIETPGGHPNKPPWSLLYGLRRSGCVPTRRARLLGVRPTSDLAGRSGCYSLSAAFHRPTCALRAFVGLPSVSPLREAPDSIRPLSPDTGHVFAFVMSSILEFDGAMPDVCPFATRVSCGFMAFWATKSHAPLAFPLRGLAGFHDAVTHASPRWRQLRSTW
jgi:hypothetical protein